MLLPEQVLPFLSHENAEIRCRAAWYLSDHGDKSPPQTADELWRAIDIAGDRLNQMKLPEKATYFRALTRVPVTDSSLERAIETLKNLKPDDDIRFHIYSYFASMPVEILDQHREQILPLVEKSSRLSLEHRLALRSIPVDDLWQGLIDLASSADTGETEKPDQAVATRIVEALAAHCDIAIPRAMEVMSFPDNRYWLETWCIELLGLLRHDPAIDLMVQDIIHDDDDFMHIVARDALQRMEPGLAVPRLEAIYDLEENQEMGNRARIFMTLGKIKHPFAEAALIRFLNRKTDVNDISTICVALADLFTTDGLESLRKVVIDQSYDLSYVDAMEELVLVATMTGYQPPELEQWKKDLVDPAEIRRKRLIRLEKMGITEMESDAMAELIEGKSPAGILALMRQIMSDKLEPELDEPYVPRQSLAPIRRQTPKIGRNDPCPCGSGKKYKKCCGK